MKKKSFFGSLFSVISQAADLTTEAMNAVDKGAQKVTNTIERMKIVREHCTDVQEYLSDEKYLLEITLRIVEPYLSIEEKMSDPVFKKHYLEAYKQLDSNEPYLPLSQQLAKVYPSLGYLLHIKMQIIPKPLPSDDPQISIEISERFNDLLAVHAGDLKHIKQTLNRDKRLAEAVKKSLADNGLTLLWEKLMAS